MDQIYSLSNRSSGKLFRSDNLSDGFDNRLKTIRSEIDSIPAEKFLNTSMDDLCKFFFSKFEIETLSIHPEQKRMQSFEVQVDIHNDLFRDIDYRRMPYTVPGLRIEVEIPCEGNTDLFYARPNQLFTVHSIGEVKGNILVLSCETASDDSGENIKKDFERRINQITTEIGWVNEEVKAFNSTLKNQIVQMLINRKERILANQAKLEAIGIPIKKRESLNPAFSIPEIRKKVIPVMPKASSDEYFPEPLIDMSVYEAILGTMQSLALGIEKSPSAYSKMKEEDIRDHFLVYLNANFEGRATSETFNQGGHTDILIK